MKRVVAVVLRAPLALAVIALVQALLEAAGTVPLIGAAQAFSIPSLRANAIESLPWVLSLSAWYLAIVAGRRFSSRLAAHALLLACICLAAIGGLLLQRSPRTEQDPVRGGLPLGYFAVFDDREIAIARISGSEAKSVTIEDARREPRLSHHESAQWDTDTGTLSVGSLKLELRADRAPDRKRMSPPLLDAGGNLESWMDTPHTAGSLVLAALSFALLATGVRFPVRLFRWPLPGALLGLLFAWAMPGLYAIFGSPTTHLGFMMLGLDLAQPVRAGILSIAAGLLLLVADLTFRTPDPVDGAVNA